MEVEGVIAGTGGETASGFGSTEEVEKRTEDI